MKGSINRGLLYIRVTLLHLITISFLLHYNNLSFASTGLVNLVDVMVGTLKVGQGFGVNNSGQTFPAVGVPFAMTYWTPQTQHGEAKCLSPYYYNDLKMQGFRGSHWISGSCTQDYGSFTLMPIVGDLKLTPTNRASSFNHKSEIATPSYYRVDLSDYGIRAELTGSSRSGYMQFTFPEADNAYIVLNPNPRLGETFVELIPERNEIVGYNPVHRIYQGSGKPAGFNGYFVARFSKPFSSYGTAINEERNPNSMNVKGSKDKLPSAYIRFSTKRDDVIEVKIGTSFTSIEQARKNLDSEIPHWNFDRIRKQSESSWNSRLGKIQVEGGSEEQKRIFYTALYHASLHPRLYSDVDGSYPSFTGKNGIKKSKKFLYYDDFSMWDTYRALHPLLVLTDPNRTSDMVTSMIEKAEDGGWLPIFPCWNSYTSAMIGDHVISMISDAYIKGVRGFDIQKAYRYMKKNATEMPKDREDYIDGKGRRALDSYLRFGYVPLEDKVLDAFHKGEQVSRTLEYAYDDFALAQVASMLGFKDDHKIFMNRASSYKKVFDQSVGFVRGRYQDGSWITPFDPTEFHPYITEGTPWHYTWYVPHDVEGLIELMGGREKFIEKLDQLFSNNYYWHGNEPSHHIAYLYNYAGAPWKTQERVKEIMKREYGLGAEGIKGNDDAGQLSAWYVFSAIGFYPVCPGKSSYELGSPIFNSVKIGLDNGRAFKIVVNGNSETNKYIKSVRLNGKIYDKHWLDHKDIVKGGTMIIEMSAEPNKSGGA
jgi:predicted alpha-1,2-mannosidase